MRILDAEMLQQPFALFRIVRPADRLDAAAGAAGFAPVERDAGVVPRQVVEELELLVDAEGRPLLDSRIEAAARVKQNWRAGAQHLVARLDAIDARRRHLYTPSQPRFFRLSSTQVLGSSLPAWVLARVLASASFFARACSWILAVCSNGTHSSPSSSPSIRSPGSITMPSRATGTLISPGPSLKGPRWVMPAANTGKLLLLIQP